jgi:hypothetical protein
MQLMQFGTSFRCRRRGREFAARGTGEMQRGWHTIRPSLSSSRVYGNIILQSRLYRVDRPGRDAAPKNRGPSTSARA